jgi:hypothetical protein
MAEGLPGDRASSGHFSTMDIDFRVSSVTYSGFNMDQTQFCSLLRSWVLSGLSCSLASCLQRVSPQGYRVDAGGNFRNRTYLFPKSTPALFVPGDSGYRPLPHPLLRAPGHG